MEYELSYIQSKINQLESLEGAELDELLHDAIFDSTCIGICMNKGCDYTTDIEPDSRSGWCEVCCTNTVWSVIEMAI